MQLPKLYAEDWSGAIKAGCVGFLGLGAYYLSMVASKRQINPACDLKAPNEAISADPIILNALLNLQKYRDLNPVIFMLAVRNVDRLLFMEGALLQKKTFVCRRDKHLAFTFLRVAINRMQDLIYLIKTHTSAEHALVASLEAEKIYTQLQKHTLNIFHMASKFNPQSFIERANDVVKKAMQNNDNRRGPKHREQRWRKLLRRQARKEKRARRMSREKPRRHSTKSATY